MSQEESQEELFNRLLTDIEKSPEEIPNSIFAATKLPSPSLRLGALSHSCSSHDIIKVMKSGIFHKGGIKGIPDKRGGYKSWPLKDLALFILMANSLIVSHDMNEIMTKLWKEEHSKRERSCISAIDNIIKEIDQLELDHTTVFLARGSLAKLIMVRKYLWSIKSDLMSKPCSKLPTDLREKGDRIDSIIDLFQEQAHPKTPDATISEAVSTLLKAFSIFMEPSAIRQRMYRKKLTQNI